MKLERDLLKQISKRLSLYHMMGQIIWWSRLNSGHVKTYFGTYIKLCDKNTPDFIVLYYDKSHGLNALFIEAKSDTGRLSKGQKEFSDRYTQPNIMILTLRDIKELDMFLEQSAIDITEGMKEWNLK